MTKEEKQLLFIELCTRLPYGVKIKTSMGVGILHSIDYIPDGAYLGVSINGAVKLYFEYQDTKPHLRPMSSITEEEFEKLKEYSGLKYEQLDLASFQNGTYKCLDFYLSEVPSDVVILVFDWLNAHHFDYRGLIPMGLALEAPEGMYKTE